MRPINNLPTGLFKIDHKMKISQKCLVPQKYPVNAYGLRDDLSGDMLASSRHNVVPLVLAPNQKLLPTP